MDDIGRLAMREEGEFWVAYYAQTGTMEGAIMLGTIRMRFVQDESHKTAFLGLMREAMGDMLKEIVGERPIWNPPAPAPEHERTREA